ncbi:predicted protein [Sparassis crispa]|uniref:NAD-dependent epimerase/dehydratase domain-containing protein n=1 Tax=Sparassis crispa TaxID=139825 RepID=A0A401GN52_9APHY|nr:predicted protein [Sparassis crispa]GBE83645.1 predicted protein [Sparassis crispa]
MKLQLTFLRDNVLINNNVLYTLYLFGIKKDISCLLTCVFPDKLHAGKEAGGHMYKDQYGCNITSAIPMNIFGPHDNYDLESAHVIPGLIHKCYLVKKNGTPFIVEDTGKPLRQFIYSHDLAKLFIWQLQEYKDVKPLILSNKHQAVVDVIVKAMEFKDEYTFNTSHTDGQFCKPASNKKLLSLIGEFKFTPFKEGS